MSLFRFCIQVAAGNCMYEALKKQPQLGELLLRSKPMVGAKVKTSRKGESRSASSKGQSETFPVGGFTSPRSRDINLLVYICNRWRSVGAAACLQSRGLEVPLVGRSHKYSEDVACASLGRCSFCEETTMLHPLLAVNL